MNNRYLIGLDLDGTLLNKKSKITFKTKNYIKKLSRKGHIVVLATGRPLRAMKKYYDQLGLKTPIVCYNGGHILNPFDNEFEEVKHSFSKDEILSIINNVGLDKIDNIMCELDNKVWVYKEDKKLQYILWQNNLDLKYGDLNNTLNEDPITFLTFSTHPECKKRLKEEVRKYPHLKYRFWHGYLDNFSEIFNKKISKYNSLKHIAKYYKIPLNNIIAFGDGDNDVDMLSKANYGFAMKNAKDEVKKKAKYITTKDNIHNGVIHELKQIIK